MPTENQNHPDDHPAIERLHQQYVGKIESFSDDLMAFQDAAYAMGLGRGKLLEAKRADALQQRLNAADERADVLEGLLLQTNELLYAIQGDPGSVPSSAIDAMRGGVFTALKPVEAPINQCDGCQAGIPVVNGAHRMGKPGSYPDTMSCTAKLYKP